MEPERPIERVLRAFARKRREQAGEPLQLHPVNRRLLQEEAGRRQRTRRETSWLDWLKHPRFAYALAAAVLLGVSGTLLLLRERDTSSEFSLASQRSDSTAPAESAAEERPQRAPASAAPAFERLQKGEAVNEPVVTAEPRMQIEQDRARQTVEPGVPPVSSATDSIAVGAATSAALFAETTTAAIGLEGRFVTVTNDVAGGESVLQSFRLRQTNGLLQVIDADGSVYEGAITAGSTRQAFQGLTAAAPMREQAGTGSVAALHFEVSGTNVTRQTPVQFAGALVPAINVEAGTNAISADARSEPMQMPVPLPVLLDGRWSVEGTAVVGGTNTIRIRAEPER